MDFAKQHLGSLDGVPRVKAVSTVTPRYPQTMLELPDFATDSSVVVAPPARSFSDSIAGTAYEEAGIGPDDLEPRRGLRPLDRARARLVREHRLCGEGEAEGLLRDGATEIGGESR